MKLYWWHATTQGCPWISKYQESVFLSVGAISPPPLLSPSSLPRGSTTAAAAVSVDKDVGATSPFHIFQCSTWAKLRVIAGQFHHSHLFCLPSICLFSRVSHPHAKQYEFCSGTTLFPKPSHSIWRRHQFLFFVFLSLLLPKTLFSRVWHPCAAIFSYDHAHHGEKRACFCALMCVDSCIHSHIKKWKKGLQ